MLWSEFPLGKKHHTGSKIADVDQELIFFISEDGIVYPQSMFIHLFIYLFLARLFFFYLTTNTA